MIRHTQPTHELPRPALPVCAAKLLRPEVTVLTAGIGRFGDAWYVWKTPADLIAATLDAGVQCPCGTTWRIETA